MEKNVLTGIERELVLQYLVDGNVPVTISLVQNENDVDDEKMHPLETAVFPVALKSEKISVLKEGIILLKNPPKSILDFIEKDVRVEFYFNRVGLFFETKMKNVKAGYAIVIPKEINRIKDKDVKQNYDFSGVLHYKTGSSDESGESSVDISCVPSDGYKLFEKPSWASIKTENQKKAKEYLEQFVDAARETQKAGNGVQLINVCRYLTEKKAEIFQEVQGRLQALDILFVNHERIVLGMQKNDSFAFKVGDEYSLSLQFFLKATPNITRDVKISCHTDYVYADEKCEKFVADCSFYDIKEEDERFLYEKYTKFLMCA